MRVFIDTNIYLGFFRTSKEKLKSLDELEILIKDKKISLVFPKITQEELSRDIPVVSLFYCETLDQQLPKKLQFAVVIDKNDRKKVEGLHKQYLEALKELKEQYLQSVDVLSKRLLDDITKISADIHETDNLVQAAYFRKLRGNPPGKRQDPLGDEIAWEVLFSFCLDNDLTIIAADKDWKNPQNQKEIHPFLKREWGSKSEKKIEVFDSLGEFINSVTGKNTISKEEIREEKQSIHVSQLLNLGTISNMGSIASGASIAITSPNVINANPVYNPAVYANPLAYTPINMGVAPFNTSPLTIIGSTVKCQNCGKSYTPSGFNLTGTGNNYCDECKTKR